MTNEPADQDVQTLLKLYAEKKISPVEVIDNVLERAERFESHVNAFSLIDHEKAKKTAQASEARWAKGEPLGSLDGIPTTIKDIVWSTDWPTTIGSKVLAADGPAQEDAPCVARLKEAGAVLIGMTTTPELGWKAVTDSPLLGVTRNPWDCTKTPGGSSGGAAVSAALGVGNLHIGTDGGGSIRIPAGFTGVVGHKPSFGRVPAYPISALGTVAHIGPITRSVDDAAAMLDVISQPDVRDWYALPTDKQSFTADINGGVAGLKIAYSRNLGWIDVDPEIQLSVDRAVRKFEELGAIVEEADPGFDCPQEIFHTLWFSGAARRVAGLSKEQKNQLDPGLLEIIEQGENYQLFDYLAAIDQRFDLGKKMRLFHQKYDLLITPTLPFAAFDAGLEIPDPSRGGRWTDWAGFSYPFNLTQQPACSVPCGLTESGLPIGVQIVGPMHADALVLRAAKAFEQTRKWTFPEVPIGTV